MDLSKLMAGLGLGGDKGGNSDMMKQAENMWKMLDDLAENNPEGYQKFVSSNIEQGKQVIKTEHEKEVKDYTRSLSKDSFKATLLVNFELRPKLDTADLKAPTSVMIDQKLAKSKTLKGSVLISIFSVKDQPSDSPPSLDHMAVHTRDIHISASVCAAFSPADASGLLASPMTGGARLAIGHALDRLDGLLPREVARQQRCDSMPDGECIDARVYVCCMMPDDLKRLPRYVDCRGGTDMPKSVVLDSLLIEAKQRLRSEGKPKDEKPTTKAEVIFKQEQKNEDVIEEKKTQTIKADKSGPKIQVLAEEINFDSMIVEKSITDKLVEISIEIDSVETMKELDLEISNKDIKLYKVGPDRYTYISQNFAVPR